MATISDFLHGLAKRPRYGVFWCKFFIACFAFCMCASAGTSSNYFVIQVIDESTGRGVPLVELTTVNSVSYWTDSHGIVAFHEPGLMGQEVFFHVRSDGYECPKDFFDNRGVKLLPIGGEKAVIKLKRINIAERLYRVTGEGIYRDSVLVGQSAPIKQPLLNAQVMGQDTVIATPYNGKIYWFWGDTDRASYPLGNFGASGATSELPGHGGLDPSVGVDLIYFVDKTGFSKPMCPDLEFGKGVKWIEGLMTLRDGQARERLLARVAAGTGLHDTREWHLAMFNDEKEIFQSLVHWDIHDTHDSAHPFRARVGTNDYFYLYPNYRVRADLQSVTNLAAYEAFTCFLPGSKAKLDRSPEGKLSYRWQAGADRLTGSKTRELVKSGALKPDEAWLRLRDIDTGKPVEDDRGSVCWNEYRQRWITIASGRPGEIWFAEADTPVGPWIFARRVVSHDNYNFYNPTQQPFFDQEGGRVIYFEGTYTASFSGAKAKTPRYDYNQIMYRLTLDDPRLDLPAPVYSVTNADGNIRLMMRPDVEAARAWNQIESVPFLALPGNRRREGFIPVYASIENGAMVLRRESSGAQPLFWAPLSGTNENVVPLYEYHRGPQRIYRTRSDAERSPERLCHVWRNPMSLVIFDGEVKP